MHGVRFSPADQGTWVVTLLGNLPDSCPVTRLLQLRILAPCHPVDQVSRWLGGLPEIASGIAYQSGVYPRSGHDAVLGTAGILLHECFLC